MTKPDHRNPPISWALVVIAGFCMTACDRSGETEAHPGPVQPQDTELDDASLTGDGQSATPLERRAAEPVRADPPLKIRFFVDPPTKPTLDGPQRVGFYLFWSPVDPSPPKATLEIALAPGGETAELEKCVLSPGSWRGSKSRVSVVDGVATSFIVWAHLTTTGEPPVEIPPIDVTLTVDAGHLHVALGESDWIQIDRPGQHQSGLGEPVKITLEGTFEGASPAGNGRYLIVHQSSPPHLRLLDTESFTWVDSPLGQLPENSLATSDSQHLYTYNPESSELARWSFETFDQSLSKITSYKPRALSAAPANTSSPLFLANESGCWLARKSDLKPLPLFSPQATIGDRSDGSMLFNHFSLRDPDSGTATGMTAGSKPFEMLAKSSGDGTFHVLRVAEIETDASTAVVKSLAQYGVSLLRSPVCKHLFAQAPNRSIHRSKIDLGLRGDLVFGIGKTGLLSVEHITGQRQDPRLEFHEPPSNSAGFAFPDPYSPAFLLIKSVPRTASFDPVDVELHSFVASHGPHPTFAAPSEILPRWNVPVDDSRLPPDRIFFSALHGYLISFPGNRGGFARRIQPDLLPSDPSPSDAPTIVPPPPANAHRGEKWTHTFKLTRPDAAVRYRVIDAPEGAAITAEGSLSWNVADIYPQNIAHFEIEASTPGGQSDRAVFHINVAGLPPARVNRTSRSTTDPFPAPGTPGELVPANQLTLPFPAAHIAQGGGGDILFALDHARRSLALIDISGESVSRQIVLPSSAAIACSDADAIYIFYPRLRTIERRRLDDLQRTAAKRLPEKTTLVSFGAGAASSRRPLPALVSSRGQVSLVPLNSETLEFGTPMAGLPSTGPAEAGQKNTRMIGALQVSPDGKYLALGSTLVALDRPPSEIDGPRKIAPDIVAHLPGPLGKHLVGEGRLIDPKSGRTVSFVQNSMLPTMQADLAGRYWLARHQTMGEEGRRTMIQFIDSSDLRAVAAIDNLAEFSGGGSQAFSVPSRPPRQFFDSRSRVLVTLDTFAQTIYFRHLTPAAVGFEL